MTLFCCFLPSKINNAIILHGTGTGTNSHLAENDGTSVLDGGVGEGGPVLRGEGGPQGHRHKATF